MPLNVRKPAQAHRALSIPEILRLVIEFSDIRDRAACVRVAKGWFEVAIEELWRELRGPIPLLQILCGDRRGMETSDDESNYDLPSEDLWDRFYLYAEHVRSLTIGCDSEFERWDTAAVLGLLSMKPRSYLIPNLNHLEWSVEMRVANLIPFLSPKITSIHVSFLIEPDTNNEKPKNIEVALSTIRRRCPLIERFGCDCPPMLPGLQTTISHFLAGSPSLKTVILSDWLLGSVTLEGLASGPSLEHVGISSIPGEHKHHESRTNPDLELYPVTDYNLFTRQDSFRCLKHLEIATTTGAVIAFSKSHSFPPMLRSFAFRLTPSDILSQAVQFFKAMANTLPLIERLEVYADDGDEHDVRGSIPFNAVEPLTQCQNMQHFALSLRSYMEIEDDMLLDLAKAWPGLTHLSLDFPVSVQGAASRSATLQGISELAQYWPEMKKLKLIVDTTAPLPLPVFPARFPRLEQLSLSTFDLPTTKATEIAIFLSRVTPRTCGVSFRIPWIMRSFPPLTSVWHHVTTLVTFARRLDHHYGYSDVTSRVKTLPL